MDTQFLHELADGISTFNAEKSRQHQYDYEEYESEVLDPYEDVLAEARSRGMTKLGEGESRVVFSAGSVVAADAVVKVSLTDGTRQNQTEVELWKSFDSEMRSCVAPLLEWESGQTRWVVQRQASNANPSQTSVVREKIHDAGWTCTDLRTENIGIVDGEPVLRDFALVLSR